RYHAATLAALHAEEPTDRLQAYFDELRGRTPSWDMEVFIEGARRVCSVVGPERTPHYDNPLKGLHGPNSFTTLWNQKHPQQPATIWNQDFRRRCPPDWASKLKGGEWILLYEAEAPLSQGLNKLLSGPTTMDCGMWCQLLPWMSIRFMLGDATFDTCTGSLAKPFALTQYWDRSPNNDLSQFLDDPRPSRSAGCTITSHTCPSIQPA
ncbi:hypothetical protein K456DRAFT_1934154, partial [Colletotrichum gloeosporioides 23]